MPEAAWASAGCIRMGWCLTFGFTLTPALAAEGAGGSAPAAIPPAAATDAPATTATTAFARRDFAS